MITIENNQVLNDGVAIASIEDGVVSHGSPIANVTKGAIKKALADAGVEFKSFAFIGENPGETEELKAEAENASDPEPEQNPRLGTETPEWKEWRARQK